MNQAINRPATNLHPRPKVIPNFSSASAGRISRSSTPLLSRESSRVRPPSTAGGEVPIDSSDKAAATLIRRVLCSHASNVTGKERPIDELLPPLTSSNDVDLQLYAIIAIIVKDLVQSWYGKITSDQTFVDEVIKIVAHCTRAIESRLRRIDLELLVLDEIPALIELHITSFRLAHRVGQSQDWSTNGRILYHNLVPHPALEPLPSIEDGDSNDEQTSNEANYRIMLVQSALAVLLPTEDLENSCLRTLVTDVIAEVVLGNSVGGKVCENWFIWTAITKLAQVVNARLRPPAEFEEKEADRRSRLEKFGLLAGTEQVTAARGYKQHSTFSSIFWRILQYGYLTFAAIRFIIVGLFTARSGPRRFSQTPQHSPISKTPAFSMPGTASAKPSPILEFRLFSLSATLVDLRHRMPWLAGMMALLQHHICGGSLKLLGGTDGLLDQYLHHLLQTHLPPATLVPRGLSLLRQAIFPQNTLPPPAPPPPTADEILLIRRDCAAAIVSLLPPTVCRTLFGSDRDAWVKEVEAELDVWGDSWMNKHLGYRLVELVVVRVLPELAEKGPQELMEMRLGPKQ